MRITMLVATCVALITTPAGAIEWRGGTPEDRAAMTRIIDDWRAAYANGNADIVADGYDPQGVVMAEGAPITGPDKLRPNLARTFANNRIDMLLDVEEIEFNGSWAYINATFASKRTPKTGDAAPRFHAGRSFTLMRKTPQGWKVWRNIDTSSPDGDHLLAQLKAKP